MTDKVGNGHPSMKVSAMLGELRNTAFNLPPPMSGGRPATPTSADILDMSETSLSDEKPMGKEDDSDTEALVRHGRAIDDVCLRTLLRLVKDASDPDFQPAPGQNSGGRQLNALMDDRIKAETEIGSRLLGCIKGTGMTLEDK